MWLPYSVSLGCLEINNVFSGLPITDQYFCTFAYLQNKFRIALDGLECKGKVRLGLEFGSSCIYKVGVVQVSEAM